MTLSLRFEWYNVWFLNFIQKYMIALNILEDDSNTALHDAKEQESK